MKKIVSIVLGLCVLFSVAFTVTGCGNDEVLKRIDDLQAQNAQLAEKLGELQSGNAQLSDKINGLQSKLDEQNEIIEELKSKTAQGVFFSVREAYENGYITLEDVKSIAYYHNEKYFDDGRVYNEQIMPEDYKPKPKSPEVLTENMQRPIKQTLWECFYGSYKHEDNPFRETPDKYKIEEYCGTYAGLIAVYGNWYDTGTAVRIINIGGVKFWYRDGVQILLWKQIN